MCLRTYVCVCACVCVGWCVSVAIAIVKRPVLPLYVEGGRRTNFLYHYYYYYERGSAVAVSGHTASSIVEVRTLTDRVSWASSGTRNQCSAGQQAWSGTRYLSLPLDNWRGQRLKISASVDNWRG